MLYVIDQRLKAQGISLEKSAQGTNKRYIVWLELDFDFDFDR